MNLVPIDYHHMAFPVWQAMWLNYVGAQAAGAPALHWRTSPTNHTAIALYDKLAMQTGALSFRMEL